MGLQSRVPMPQTPFLGVLGLSYVQQSCLEGHAGPKPASKGKSPFMVIVAALVCGTGEFPMLEIVTIDL